MYDAIGAYPTRVLLAARQRRENCSWHYRPPGVFRFYVGHQRVSETRQKQKHTCRKKVKVNIFQYFLTRTFFGISTFLRYSGTIDVLWFFMVSRTTAKKKKVEMFFNGNYNKYECKCNRFCKSFNVKI